MKLKQNTVTVKDITFKHLKIIITVHYFRKSFSRSQKFQIWSSVSLYDIIVSVFFLHQHDNNNYYFYKFSKFNRYPHHPMAWVISPANLLHMWLHLYRECIITHNLIASAFGLDTAPMDGWGYNIGSTREPQTCL